VRDSVVVNTIFGISPACADVDRETPEGVGVFDLGVAERECERDFGDGVAVFDRGSGEREPVKVQLSFIDLSPKNPRCMFANLSVSSRGSYSSYSSHLEGDR
jgi:hypothetical protein